MIDIDKFLRRFRMFRRKIALLASVLVALGAARLAHAGMPQLPADAINDNTFVVAHIDASMDPADVKATVEAIYGPDAPAHEPDLTKYQAKHDAMIKAGAKSMTIVVSSPADAATNPTAKPISISYIETGSGADDAAIEQGATADMPADLAAKTTWSRSGDFLVMRQDDGGALPAGSSDRAKIFADGFGQAGDGPITGVVAFTDQIRADMLKGGPKGPPQMANVMSKIMDSKYITMNVKLGATPSLHVNIFAADAAGASAISDSMNQAQAEFHKTSATMQASGGPAAGMASMFDALAALLNNTVSGSQVQMNIDVATIQPIVQSPMFKMMSGGGRGGMGGGGGYHGPPPGDGN
jgi:hypothetical protein